MGGKCGLQNLECTRHRGVYRVNPQGISDMGEMRMKEYEGGDNERTLSRMEEVERENIGKIISGIPWLRVCQENPVYGLGAEEKENHSSWHKWLRSRYS